MRSFGVNKGKLQSIYNIIMTLAAVFAGVFVILLYVPGQADMFILYSYIEDMADIFHMACLTVLAGGIWAFIVYVLYLYRYTRYLYGTCLFAGMVAATVRGIHVPPVTVIIVLFVILMTICSLTCKKNAVYLMPIIGLLCVALYFIPFSTKPLEWKTAKKTVEMVKKLFDKPEGGKGAYVSGYIDKDRVQLVESITMNTGLDMTISGEDLPRAIYITGSNYNYYDGRGWDRKYTDEEYPEDKVRIYETANRLMNMYPKWELPAIAKHKITLKYINTDKRTVFLPSNTIKYSYDSNRIIYQNNNVRYNEDIKMGSSHFAWYINILDKEGFYKPDNSELHKAWSIGTYAFQKTGGNILKEMPENMNNFLKDRYSYVCGNYMNIPGYNDNIKKLADNITSGCTCDYDKAKAIEKYLQDNYRYDLSVPLNEGGDDYLLNFLNNTKSGSCMYFATAMAMLARYEDIPSRVVTGYYVFSKSGDNISSYKVTGANGHAWTEVYIKDAGWLTLEPTPDYEVEPYDEDYSVIMEKTMAEIAKKSNNSNNSYNSNNQAVNNAGLSYSGQRNPTPASKNKAKTQGKVIYAISIISILLILAVLLTSLWKAAKRKKNSEFSLDILNDIDVSDSKEYGIIISKIIRQYEKETGDVRGSRTLYEYAKVMSEWLGEYEQSYLRLIREYQKGFFGKE